MCRRLHPYVPEAATLCAGGCIPLCVRGDFCGPAVGLQDGAYLADVLVCLIQKVALPRAGARPKGGLGLWWFGLGLELGVYGAGPSNISQHGGESASPNRTLAESIAPTAARNLARTLPSIGGEP